MKAIDAILTAAAILIGACAACSTERWMGAADRGHIRVREAKESLMSSAGLLALHNRIYSEVGELAWESRVKPKFLSGITRAAAMESGNFLPEPSDILSWVRTHPTEARRMLEEAALVERQD